MEQVDYIRTGFYGDKALALVKLVWALSRFGQDASMFKVSLDCPEVTGVELELAISITLSYKDKDEPAQFGDIDTLYEHVRQPLQQIGTPFMHHVVDIRSDERGEVVALVRDAPALSDDFYRSKLAARICEWLKVVLDALKEQTPEDHKQFSVKMAEWLIALISVRCSRRWVATPREVVLGVSTSVREMEELVLDFEAKIAGKPVDRSHEWLVPIQNPIEIEARRVVASERAKVATAFGKRVYEANEKLTKEADKKWIAEADSIRQEFSDIPSIGKLTPRK